MSSTTRDTSEAAGGPRVPPTLKPQIRRAMAAHLREHGDCDWDFVREHPEFAAYIGRQSGETGRKMFQRWKRELSAPLKPDRTRPKEGREIIEGHQAWANDQAPAPADGLPMRPTPTQLMAQGRSALRGHQVVAARLQQAAEDIDRLRQCALAPDPTGVNGLAVRDPQLLAGAVKLQHDNAHALTGFLGQVTKLQESQEFAQEIAIAIETELADVPDHRERVIARLEQIVERYQGAR
jgi:hypothetical protein